MIVGVMVAKRIFIVTLKMRLAIIKRDRPFDFRFVSHSQPINAIPPPGPKRRVRGGASFPLIIEKS